MTSRDERPEHDLAAVARAVAGMLLDLYPRTTCGTGPQANKVVVRGADGGTKTRNAVRTLAKVAAEPHVVSLVRVSTYWIITVGSPGTADAVFDGVVTNEGYDDE